MVKLDVNNRKKNIKNTSTWRLNNTPLNNQHITEEIKKRNQNMHRKKNENEKHNSPKPIGFSKSSAKGKVHSNTSLPQETGVISNKLTLHIKQLGKEEMKHTRVSRRKEIIKIREEINAKEKRRL